MFRRKIVPYHRVGCEERADRRLGGRHPGRHDVPVCDRRGRDNGIAGRIVEAQTITGLHREVDVRERVQRPRGQLLDRRFADDGISFESVRSEDHHAQRLSGKAGADGVGAPAGDPPVARRHDEVRPCCNP